MFSLAAPLSCLLFPKAFPKPIYAGPHFTPFASSSIGRLLSTSMPLLSLPSVYGYKQIFTYMKADFTPWETSN
ncbi:hypothetical protein BDZ91DRAFT_722954, partial [Kalaharituber pfeilii]